MENYSLVCPDEFDFPFPPYTIQIDFMRRLYNVINQKKLGIFESPTGTGKSLSLICGTIRWLKDFYQNQKETLSTIIETLEKEKKEISDNSSDWLDCQSKHIEINSKLNEVRSLQNDMIEYEKKIEKLKETTKEEIKFLKMKNLSQKNTVDEKIDNDENINDEALIIEDIEESSESSDEENEENPGFKPVKVFISSRTHSQLSQFVGEIIKSPFGKNVRTVSLASRQVYCINAEVTKLKNMALMNEKCLEMQKASNSKKTKVEENGKVIKKQRKENCKCSFYKTQNIEKLRQMALVDIMDVEDLVVSGKKLKACPYYASRKAADDAEIVLIPYNTLLHKATREANGIDLKNNIVIVDEAHNLLESLGQMHNVDVNLIQIEHSLNQLRGYKQRFNKMFSAATLLLINQLIFIINNLKESLENGYQELKEQKSDIFEVGAFVLNVHIENYNMFKLVKFAKSVKLAQKIRHYSLKYSNEEPPTTQVEKKGLKNFLSQIKSSRPSTSNNRKPNIEQIPENTKTTISEKETTEIIPVNPLVSVLSFLEALTYSYEDGRILMLKNNEKKLCKYQFLLLNPTLHFKSIIEEARSVIVAGGTMKPISEFRDRLFRGAGADINRIVEFSCDHIIPPENILPIVVVANSEGNKVSFEFNNRMKMIGNIRQVLQAACDKIPGGIVIFFPSYQYENWVWEQLKNTAFGRPVFREPKGSGSVEEVLEKYSLAIKKSKLKKALLFSVVGGKLSEGLNFSDDLGRCVIVIGLPYANIKAADLNEKMAYLDKKEGPNSGRIFYENLCMKAVNQCIGRAVRHKNDYATVILFDERYNRHSTKNALPGWIKKNIQVCNFNEAFSKVGKFFQERDAKQI